MKSVINFIVKPKNKRYNNTKKIGSKELILNTEIFTHQNVSRNAIVLQTPTVGCTDIKQGDEVIVHHNVFRRWKDIRNKEKNSKAFYKEDMYFVMPDQIFAYKRNNKWFCPDEYCFVSPLINEDEWAPETEQKLKGELVYSNDELGSLGLAIGDVVGFTPDSEYEFEIEGKKLYRILSNQVTINYGQEKTSN